MYSSLLIVSNADKQTASAFGRILPNFVADVAGPINVFILTAIITGILLFSWLGVSTWQSFIIFTILYGFFAGATLSLSAACVAALTDADEMSKIGVRMGMMFRYAALRRK
jgi:MFS family permease